MVRFVSQGIAHSPPDEKVKRKIQGCGPNMSVGHTRVNQAGTVDTGEQSFDLRKMIKVMNVAEVTQYRISRLGKGRKMPAVPLRSYEGPD
jgi:hypothetical protein